MLALCHTALPPVLSLPPRLPTLCSGRLTHMDSFVLGFQLVWPMGCIRGAWREGGRGPSEGSAALAPTSVPSVTLPLQGHLLHHLRPKMLTAPGVIHWGTGALPAAFPKAAQTSTNNPITKLSSRRRLCVCCVFPAGPLNDRHGMQKHHSSHAPTGRT